jgi:hypothetical protein
MSWCRRHDPAAIAFAIQVSVRHSSFFDAENDAMTPSRTRENSLLIWTCRLFGIVLLTSATPAALGAEEQHHNKYAVAGFIGATRANGSNELTLGVEGGYNFSEKWSIGAVIERAEREQHSTLFLIGVGWHPLGPELRLQLALGRKDPSGHTETVIRTGIGYELELENSWFIKPYAAVDFISNEDHEPVFGLYVGRGF